MTAAIEPIRSLGARHLPRAAAGRFRPLRAGIRNVWEYDNQEFWFADGRLILRGANTAGKSKALELLLPFVLDGDIRPERLDPFGARSKTMYWNLIEFDEDRRVEIGYCWLEFGRVDPDGEEHVVTVIVGMRASRTAGRKVDTWFAVTPLRVGLQLDLAPQNRPLAPERLREALDGRGRFSATARDHRVAVDQALFHLGAERFEGLLHLLLQLRRPKLSEKLEVTKLADVLTEALPPLERGRLELLAQGFARLDSEASELEALEGARAELEAFLASYRLYARVHARLRADAVRTANSRLDDVTRTERRQRQAFEDAAGELTQVEQQRTELDRELARARGQLEGLDLSKVQHLQLVERQAVDAERAASASRRRADQDERVAGDAEELASAAEAEATDLVGARERTMATAADRAVEAGMAVAFDAHRAQLAADPHGARRALDAAADRRSALLQGVRQAAAVDASARAEFGHAQARADDADGAVAEAVRHAEAAARSIEAEAESFAQEVDRWAGSFDEDLAARVATPPDLGDQALSRVLAAGGGEEAAREIVDRLTGPARTSLAQERAEILGRVERHTAERDALVADRSRIAAEEDDAPPAAAGRPESRAEGGAPLWACVDFVPSLPDGARANLEAALHAAGLLDALVTPDGRLVDPTALDTVLAGAGVDASQASIREWLAPDPDCPLPAGAVEAALAAIGAGQSHDGSAVWVACEGRWANGALAGRWSKPAAEYVGASARAAARTRRINAIDHQVGALDVLLAELARTAESYADQEARLARAARAFPSPAPLRDALLDEVRAGKQVGRARDVAARATEALDITRGRAEQAGQALHRVEQDAGCRAHGVDTVVAALGKLRESMIEAVAAVDAAARSQGASERAGTVASQARQRAAESAAAATHDEQEADRRRGEADELRRTEGADIDAVLARKAHLESEVATAVTRQDVLATRRDEVRDNLKVAQTQLAATELEREQRERVRTEGLLALAAFASTELGALAVGALDIDRDLTQVTAGLAFARTMAERLGEVATDQRAQDSASNRVHASFTDLRARLGADFDPHLDTSDGLALCFAKLNGAAVGATDLASALDEQVRRRRETLSSEERDLIERHLLAEVGGHLGDRVHAAWSHIRHMNDQLAQHPTGSGVTLHLAWEPDPDAGPGAVEALRLLRRDVQLLDATERAALAAFLADRVRMARDDAEGADAVERMAAALDYRRWHRFHVIRRSNGRDERFTSRTQGRGSGGEQAKLAHLPLFAATAGYYATAHELAPRLLVLDEAFAGIDESQRADCMGMLVELGLDVVLTNYAEWGFYPQVPSVATYHLERTEGQRGVAAIRFVWDGVRGGEDDPFLESIEQPHEGLFADS